MTECAASWRVNLRYLAKLFHVPATASTTPPRAAGTIAKRAEFLLYETQAELVVGSDGCRNRILWRYYHPQG